MPDSMSACCSSPMAMFKPCCRRWPRDSEDGIRSHSVSTTSEDFAPQTCRPPWLPHEVTGRCEQDECSKRADGMESNADLPSREKKWQDQQTSALRSQSHLRQRTRPEATTILEGTGSQQQLLATASGRAQISKQPGTHPSPSSGTVNDSQSEHSQAGRASEVSRILQSDAPWEVLGVRKCSPNAVCRREYLCRSLMVHPDKCKHPKAGEAFGRLADAYRCMTEGGPWHGPTAWQDAHSSSFHSQHERSQPFNRPHGREGNHREDGRGQDPFAFFREAAEQAFEAGEFAREDFSDLFGQPAAVGGALVGAVLMGGLGSMLGGTLGSVAGGLAALEGTSTCQCRRSWREGGGGRCEICLGRTSLGTSLGGAAGGTAGMALGAAAGAAIGAKLRSAIASAFAADNDRSHAAGERDKKCPGSGGCHDLAEKTVVRPMVFCGQCSVRQRPGTVVWSCSLCSFAWCQACARAKFERDCSQQ
eukprot:TRINITY_DN38511_c0_g1_i1.p1 TRINITY_DN38511_c0_g1~~TRINITY_DN38511_c0_g1_i1.p1  ORF type:complete len:476 (-),score=64.52 TRINITY_DN38511_c0_g1_i1:126-1553(-)